MAAAMLGAGVRLLPLPHLFVDGRLHLTSGDGHYHLRRMALAAADALPGLDRWLHHPRGMTAHWPPLFDGTGGLLVRLAGGGPADMSTTAGVAVAFVAVLTAATFALVFAMASRRGGTLAGWLAVIALALLPGHHNYTQAGKVDHHVVEPLATFGALEAMLLATAASSPRLRFLWAGVAALAMVVLMASLPSSAVPLLLLGGCAMLRLAVARDRAARIGVPLVAAFAVAGVAGLPIAGTDRVVSWNLSLLQPVIVLCMALALGVTAALRRFSMPVAVLAGTVLASTAVLAWPAGRAALLGGTEFIASADFVGLIDESASPWSLGVARALRFLSPLVLLAPLLVVSAARSDAILVAALAVTTVLALIQLRFVMLLAVPLCVLAGVAAASFARRGALAVALVVAAGVLLAASAAPFLVAPPPALAPRLAVWRALDWIRRATPPAGDPWRWEVPPSWTVLSPWSFGHEVVVLGERATVASPFIAPGETDALADTLRVALATDPAAAEPILRAHDVRYLLSVPTPPATVERYARAIAAPPERAGDPRVSAYALWARNGSADAEGNPAWDFLRLVAVAGDGAKVFEYVPGARVHGDAGAPGAEVLVRIDLDVDGAPASWFTRGRAGADGRFSLRVPYATDVTPAGNVRVVRAAMRVAGRIVPLGIPGTAVVEGGTVSLDGTPPGPT